ncbi:MAG TPA: DUF692 domain-containing protein [Mycobacteriales bacterium]|nr:DUF692 domain-containing protein [Mycobacteriales bacterium]
MAVAELGVGIGWRPEIDLTVERLSGVDFVEVVAENVCAGHLPGSLRLLRSRGVPVLPHGVTLSLGGAEPPDPARLARLAELAVALDAPLVSEHVAFVRAGGREAGHLLPVPRTREALEVVVANVRAAQAALPVPLAVENVAALFGWPGDELTDGQFLAELVERTGVRLLVDVANLYTNQVNLGLDPLAALDRLPLHAIAYVHVAGGVRRDGVWHDTHAHPVPSAVLDLLAELCARVAVPGVLLERDEAFPTDAALAAELAAIRAVVESSRPAPHGPSPVGEERPRVALTVARERLGRAQEELLAGLAAGTAPPGFDAERIDVQAGALLAKRREAVARRLPELAETADFRVRFDAYAKGNPRPPAGSAADADAFARALS